MKKIIIAIDGFSSCGKSTLAKQLAQKLSYIFVDSGAMYRAITLHFLQQKLGQQKLETLGTIMPKPIEIINNAIDNYLFQRSYNKLSINLGDLSNIKEQLLSLRDKCPQEQLPLIQ